MKCNHRNIQFAKETELRIHVESLHESKNSCEGFEENFSFKSMTAVKITKIVKQLKNTKAAGID